jgi:microcystin-dependent protein
MTFWKWSRTAADNGTADSTCPFPEGMSPAAINDGARGLMAAAAKYRDDMAGAIATGGTSTAYTVSSYQSFDSLAHLDGKAIAFTPHTTCGATVTLNVDSLGAKPLRSAPGVELPAGTIIQGTPYLALYNNSDGAFYLHGFFGNPYGIPIGASVDFWGSSAPNSSFVLAYGQAISRTTYATLFSLLGTAYGTGDGSTTFNVPDCRGRFIAGADGMGGTLAGRLNATGGMNGVGIGATGGAQTHTLTLGELPTGITATGSGSASVTVAGGQTLPAISNGWSNVSIQNGGASGIQFNGTQTVQNVSTINGSATGITTTSNNTGGSAHIIVPPAIVANKLLRII